MKSLPPCGTATLHSKAGSQLKERMKVQCKNCLPKEGIEIPDFSAAEKEQYRKLKEDSPVRAVKELMDEKSLSHRDAKYIVTHINIEYGHCNRCSFSELDEEYGKCPKCGVLNFNWTRFKIEFKLWLEFEEVDPDNWDIENEFTNIRVDLPDGRHYGINVWTYKFLETAVRQDRENGENLNGIYMRPPDLFVKELTRDCIEKTIDDLLKQGDLEKMLNSAILEEKE